MEQLIAPEQQRRNALADLGGRLVHAQFVHREWLLGTSFAVEAAVDRGVFPDLVHAPRVAFVHDEHVFEFFGGAFFRVVRFGLERWQTAGVSDWEDDYIL